MQGSVVEVIRDKALRIYSAMPSQKYSWSFSLLMPLKGRTAVDRPYSSPNVWGISTTARFCAIQESNSDL